jgi:hypothetical protein
MNDVKSNGEMVAGEAKPKRRLEAGLKFTISPKRDCEVVVCRVECWNLGEAVGSILPGEDEIEGGEGKRLEVLHILGITSNVV